MVYEPTDPSEPRCPSSDSSSDSEDEAESPLKREGGGAESNSKRARTSAEEQLKSLLATSTVRQILKELDELPEFQLTKAKGGVGCFVRSATRSVLRSTLRRVSRRWSLRSDSGRLGPWTSRPLTPKTGNPGTSVSAKSEKRPRSCSSTTNHYCLSRAQCAGPSAGCKTSTTQRLPMMR